MVKAKYDSNKIIMKKCGGGYAIPSTKEISIYTKLNKQTRILTAIHEVLELHLSGEVRHSRLDSIAIDTIDALQQLKLI